MTGMLAPAVLLSLAAIACSAAPVAATDHGNDGPARGGNTCGNSDVLGFIRSNFDYRAAHYLRAEIAIAEVRDMRQKRVELRDETRPIEREYCRATAVTTDGQERALLYLIERGFGFAGIGSNIEYCVSGLDPWFVYGAQCASLR